MVVFSFLTKLMVLVRLQMKLSLAADGETFATSSNATVPLLAHNESSTISTGASTDNSPYDTTTTLVTAYYPLGSKAKASPEDYRRWIFSFFGKVRSPIVAYVPDAEMAQDIRNLRGNLSIIVKIVELWNLPPAKKHRKAFEGIQHDIDPEKDKHSPELYAIWDSKTWMLNHVAHDNPFGSKYFFWVDAGAWRYDVKYSAWPDPARIAALWQNSLGTDRLLLGTAMIMHGRLYIQAGFFGGPLAAISKWNAMFYGTLDEYIEEGLFAGKEQDVMTELFYAQPGHYLLLRADWSNYGDAWFFFEAFFASKGELNAKDLPSIQDPGLIQLGEEAIDPT